ncbi:Digestive organ expansion factor [Gossypium arboreum]|uniref:Digestive organ expansion factor n=1 Tax=Gossypium arboreum TaxID=29729 RepID=A0A0B0NE18_GOSAR|nr:Digestive organ expansion factor [Gossypium arboreum]
MSGTWHWPHYESQCMTMSGTWHRATDASSGWTSSKILSHYPAIKGYK